MMMEPSGSVPSGDGMAVTGNSHDRSFLENHSAQQQQLASQVRAWVIQASAASPPEAVAEATRHLETWWRQSSSRPEDVVAVLLGLLQPSSSLQLSQQQQQQQQASEQQVQLYALTTLERWLKESPPRQQQAAASASHDDDAMGSEEEENVWTQEEERTLLQQRVLNFLLQDFGATTDSTNIPLFLYKKAAWVWVQYLLRQEPHTMMLHCHATWLPLENRDYFLVLVATFLSDEVVSDRRHPFRQSESEALRQKVWQATVHGLTTSLVVGTNGAQPPSPRSSRTAVLALQALAQLFRVTDPERYPDCQSFATTSSTVWELLLRPALGSLAHHDRPVTRAALQTWQEYVKSSDAIMDDATADKPSSAFAVSIRMALLEQLHEGQWLPYVTPTTTTTIAGGGGGNNQQNASDEDEDPTEILIEMAQLINLMGLQALPRWEERQGRRRQENSAIHDLTAATAATNTKSPEETLFYEVLDLFFRALAYDDIDVSSAVLPMAARLGQAMETERQQQQGSVQQPLPQDASSSQGRFVLLQSHLPQLLNTLYIRLQYPNGYEYDYEDEDDAEEEVYRAELCKLYGKLVCVDPALCLQFVSKALSQFLPVSNSTMTVAASSLATAPTSDLEATLRLLYHYCEGIRPPPGMKVVMKNPTFCSLLVALYQSDIAQQPHVPILLLYYDIVVRYYPLFFQKVQTSSEQDNNNNGSSTAALLSKVLQDMTGPRGLQHSRARVRSRCCYLLLRLVKSVASLLRPMVETAVVGILGLLSKSSCLVDASSSSSINDDANNGSNGDHDLLLRPDDMLYLFETIGLLLGKTGLDPADQQRLLTQVMTPHVQSIEQTLLQVSTTQLPAPGTAHREALVAALVDQYGEVLAASIAALAHLSKGFSNKPAPEVQVVFVETVKINLRVLETLPMSEEVRNKTMVLLPRMIQCVGKKVLPMIPSFLHLLIEHVTADDICFVSQLMNQLCLKFKAEAAAVIDSSLLPFLQKCHNLVPPTQEVVVGTTDVPPHLGVEQLAIQKLAYVVLQHIVTHNATAVLLSPRNVGSLEMILQTMSSGAVVATDPVVKKCCIVFFRELVDQWAQPCADTAQDVYRRGFMTFACGVFVPGILQCMLSPSFDEADAMQARCVTELANILFLIKSKSETDVQYQSLLGNLVTTTDGSVPSNIFDAMRTVTSAKDVEVCLSEMFKVKAGLRNQRS